MSITIAHTPVAMLGTVVGPYAGFRGPMALQGPTILLQDLVSNVARSDRDSDVHEIGEHKEQIFATSRRDYCCVQMLFTVGHK